MLFPRPGARSGRIGRARETMARRCDEAAKVDRPSGSRTSPRIDPQPQARAGRITPSPARQDAARPKGSDSFVLEGEFYRVVFHKTALGHSALKGAIRA